MGAGRNKRHSMNHDNHEGTLAMLATVVMTPDVERGAAEQRLTARAG